MKDGTFSYSGIDIIPLICYEIIFPELIQKIKSKKTLLINISEDGWFVGEMRFKWYDL